MSASQNSPATSADPDPTPILVAVGLDPIESALAFAVEEARRAGCGVHLVHVLHLGAAGPEYILVDEAHAHRIARDAMNAALEQARDLARLEVPVTGDVITGPGSVTATLAEAAAQARMVVLEHRSLSRLQRVVTRSTSSGLAARTHVPVVAVPTGTVPDADAPVTVGVDLPDRSDVVLRAALREAASRGTGLRVLHVWSYPSPYEDVVITREDDARWAAQATDEIHEALARVGVPAGVAVEVEARHALPADALVEASRRSQLLVIGRHDPVVPIGSHLGPVARAVLREAGCPVLLAEPRPLRRWHASDAEGAATQPV